MALLGWLFGRTPETVGRNHTPPAKTESRAASNLTAPARPDFPHARKVPDGDFRFIALDVETACNNAASICQIGLACVQPDNRIQTFSMLVNPGTRFDAFNIRLHGIGPDHISGAPRFADALETLLPLLTRHHLVQHSNFDKQAITAACVFCGIAPPALRWSDSVAIARRAWPELKGNGGHGLANLKRTLNLQFHHHDAGEDARAAAMVVLHAEAQLAMTFDELVMPVTKGRLPVTPARTTNPNGPLAGTVVVFTGSLSMSRAEAADLAGRAGMDVQSGLTKLTTHLIVGDQDLAVLAGHTKSSKHRKADEMRDTGHPVRIMGETEFRNLLSGGSAT